MLRIYTSIDILPKTKKFILDSDAAFGIVAVSGTEFQRRVLKEIEQGEYLDKNRFIDRFGAAVYYTDMSTGSKILFLVDSCKEYVINCTECGENALSMLTLINDCDVFIDSRSNPLQWVVDCPVMFNGREWRKMSLLNDYLR